MAVVVLAVVLGAAGVADAGKKRVVVLELDGPKAGRFHDELVKLLKKSQTVVSTESWNAAAARLGAASTSERDLRKVAKQLGVDAIVLGAIERRRDQFILRLKLHDKTGALVGNGVDTQADGPRIDGQAERDIRDELVDAINNLEPGSGGAAPSSPSSPSSDDDDATAAKAKPRKAEAEPAKLASKAKRTKKPAAEADADEPPGKKPGKKPAKPVSDDDDQIDAKAKLKADDDDATQQAFAHRSDDDRAARPAARKADDDRPARPVADAPVAEPKAAAKQVAQRDDERDLDRAPADEPRPAVKPANVLSPGERALDVVVGVSVTQRDLTFESRAGLATKPASYRGSAVAGAMLDATLYPLAIGHDRTGILKDLGVTVLVDQVLKIDSRNAAGMVFPTTQYRYAAGVKYRHAFGSSPTAPVIVGALTYNIQGFEITNSAMANIPSVTYHSIEPALGIRVPFTERLSAGLDIGSPLVTDTGEIEQPTQYGTAKILGIDGSLAVDYLITRSVFARVAFRYETIVHTFDGNGTQTTSSDGDPTTVDVTSARDSYIGGFATVGALF